MKILKKLFKKIINFFPENPRTEMLNHQEQDIRWCCYLDQLFNAYEYWDRQNISQEEKLKGKQHDKEHLKEIWKIK